jgi:hypothetical protein
VNTNAKVHVNVNANANETRYNSSTGIIVSGASGNNNESSSGKLLVVGGGGRGSGVSVSSVNTPSATAVRRLKQDEIHAANEIRHGKFIKKLFYVMVTGTICTILAASAQFVFGTLVRISNQSTVGTTKDNKGMHNVYSTNREIRLKISIPHVYARAYRRLHLHLL